MVISRSTIRRPFLTQACRRSAAKRTMRPPFHNRGTTRYAGYDSHSPELPKETLQERISELRSDERHKIVVSMLESLHQEIEEMKKNYRQPKELPLESLHREMEEIKKTSQQPRQSDLPLTNRTAGRTYERSTGPNDEDMFRIVLWYLSLVAGVPLGFAFTGLYKGRMEREALTAINNKTEGYEGMGSDHKEERRRWYEMDDQRVKDFLMTP